MTHHIVWTFEGDHVDTHAECDDPECLNRYVCSDGECEVYYDVLRGDDGAVTHAQWDDGTRAIIERHRMERTKDCAALDYLNADPGIINELAVFTDDFEIGRTSVDLEWQGEDGVLWKRIPLSVDAGMEDKS